MLATLGKVLIMKYLFLAEVFFSSEETFFILFIFFCTYFAT